MYGDVRKIIKYAPTSGDFNFLPEHTSAAETSTSGMLVDDHVNGGGFPCYSTKVRIITCYWRHPHRARHIPSERIVSSPKGFWPLTRNNSLFDVCCQISRDSPKENFWKLSKTWPAKWVHIRCWSSPLYLSLHQRLTKLRYFRALSKQILRRANTWLRDLLNYWMIYIKRSLKTFGAGQIKTENLDS